MKNYKINCIGDFLKVVRGLYPDNEIAYFRGQSSSLYNINSSFYRLVKASKTEGKESNYSYRLANKLFNEFKNNMPAYSENNLLKDYELNDIDLMMVAQHYGLATRLIDWTKNPLVALYFATEKGNIKGDCSIYMMYNVQEHHPVTTTSSHSFSVSIKNEQNRLKNIYDLIEQNITNDMTTDLANKIHGLVNSGIECDFIYPPVKINKEILAMHMSQISLKMASEKAKCHSLISILQEDLVNSLCSLSSVKIFNNTKYVLNPLPLNTRIKNQQGVFVFSNELESDLINNDSLEGVSIISTYCEDAIARVDKSKGIVRIDISGDYLDEIHNELNLYGMSKDFIYPELPSYTEVMQKRVVKEVLAGKI